MFPNPQNLRNNRRTQELELEDDLEDLEETVKAVRTHLEAQPEVGR